MRTSQRWAAAFLTAAVGLALGLPAQAAQDTSTTTTQTGPAGAKEKRVAFTAQEMPWRKVFEWLSEQTGLPYLARHMPAGNFTFLAPKVGKEPRPVTVTEVLDAVNDALLTDSFVLVRGERTLTLLPANEPIDGALTPLVPVETLDRRGRSEIVRVVLSAGAAGPEDFAPEVRRLLGRFGRVTPFGNRLVVSDTVGNLRQIVRLLREVEESSEDRGVLAHKCRFVRAADAQHLLEQLLGANRGGKAGPALTVVADERSNSLYLHGPAAQTAQARTVLSKLDVAVNGQQPIEAGPPVVQTYSVAPGTAESMVAALKKILPDSPGMRIAAVGANTIIVHATPTDHLAIARHLQATPQAPTVELIPLNILNADPTAEQLRSLFRLGRGGESLALEVDRARNALLLRGTRDQVEEIRAALRALGEKPASANVRTITLEQGNATTLAEAVGQLIKRMRANPVKIVVPGGKDAPPVPKKGPDPGKTKPAPQKEQSKLPGRADQPITITAVGNRLVITSEDPEALALAMELVRLVRAGETGGGDFEVIALRRADAVSVARVLDEVFNGPRRAPGAKQPDPGERRIERVRIVAEPVSNALLVRGTPLDLLTLRQMVTKVLDGEGGAEEVIRTRIIGPLRHAKAAEVARVLREVYADGPRPSVFSVGIDTRTNSLVIRGASHLEAEIEALVQRLDQKAGDK
ncbi:MAG: hypothetical protein L0Z62_29550 [Gemmataceae bacterium]|nr:hypothetical protein [Gemmataceae bacterium]